jgi:predicted DNA-binding protein
MSMPRKRLAEPERRTRIVSFRVSGDEYARLQQISESHGSRTVSEFFRRLIETGVSADTQATVDRRLREFGERLYLLDLEVRRIAHLVERN